MAEITFKKRARKAAPSVRAQDNVQPPPFARQMKTMRTVPGAARPAESDSDEGDIDESGDNALVRPGHSAELRSGVVVQPAKRQKLESHDLSVVYNSDRTTQLTMTTAADAGLITRSSEAKSSSATDGQASRETTVRKDGAETYTGIGGYDRHTPAARRPPGSKALAGSGNSGSSVGPSRAGPTSQLRAITVVDYAPDVCKDYKQTGFCGFGDTCKFLHDRGDFKQGWQLDRDWEDAARQQRASAVRGVTPKAAPVSSRTLEADIADGKIPFKCVICKGDYRHPIETRCGHYFCERCAIERYRTTPSCAICGAGTAGIFNGAKKLKRLLEARDQREQDGS